MGTCDASSPPFTHHAYHRQRGWLAAERHGLTRQPVDVQHDGSETAEAIDGAVANLNGIGALLTAKGWERAAVVYAFTHEGVGNRFGAADDFSPAGTLTISDFKDLNINGLGSRNTIRRYRTIWAEHGATDITPGAVVELLTAAPSVP